MYNDDLEINDLLRDAHPFGGTQSVEDPTGEGRFEDLIENQMRTLEMVAREPTLKTLASLADYLDEQKLPGLADRVDDTLRFFSAESAALGAYKEIVKAAVSPERLNQLVEALSDSRRRIRMMALSELGKLEDPRVTSLVESKLVDSDPLVRATAVSVLTKLNARDSLDAIVELERKDQNPVVQREITRAKEKLRRQRVVLPTYDLTTDKFVDNETVQLPGRAKNIDSVTNFGSNVWNVQEFLVNLGYPVRSGAKRLDPDGRWGSASNTSLMRFINDAKAGRGYAGIENPAANKARAEKLLELGVVSNSANSTLSNMPLIAKVLTQPISKDKVKLEKPKELYRIDFTIDGKEIKNFPITYLLGKMNVGSDLAVKRSTIYMIEFLKAYGVPGMQPGAKTDWEVVQVPFTKAIAAISDVLDKAGYSQLQNYFAPMEEYVADMVQKQRKEKLKPAKKERQIIPLLDGIFPGGSEYHKVRQSPEGTRRLLAFLAENLRFADKDGNLIVSEGRVRGSLNNILDYAKGLLESMRQGRVTTNKNTTPSTTPTQQTDVSTKPGPA